MKNTQSVWILEKWYSREEMDKTLAEYTEMAKSVEGGTPEETEKFRQVAKEVAESQRKTIAENPEGHWLGYEGKIYYKQFISTAKEALRRDKGYDFGSHKFRVVKAVISDTAKYWTAYTDAVENEGVYNYLRSIV